MITPLKRAREHRKISQTEVAAAIGVDRSHYCRVEGGRAGASAAVAKKLSDFFNGKVTRLEILYPEDYVHARGPRLVHDPPVLQAKEA
jgi:transcriptional regulator with XRE-family HTH domain